MIISVELKCLDVDHGIHTSYHSINTFVQQGHGRRAENEIR